MKIVIDDKIPFIKGVLEPFCEVEYIAGEAIGGENIANCDAMIIRTRTKCNSELLRGSKVKFIATATIGYDHIDLDYCKTNDIEVSTAAGCNASAVVQYVLAVMERLKATPRETKVGVIGYGNIGSLLASTLHRLGFQTLINDPLKEEIESVELEYLLKNSDIVTLHVPHTTTGDYPTSNLADSSFFDKIKSGAHFINCSRGEVVDEIALLEAIKVGKLASVSIDVWKNEPNINPILLEKVDFATTHIAGYSKRGKERATEMSVRAVADRFNIEVLKNWSISDVDDRDEMDGWSEVKSIIKNYFDIEKESALLKQNPLKFEQIRSEYNFRQEFKIK